MYGQFLRSRIEIIEKVDFQSTTYLFDELCLDTFLVVRRIEFLRTGFLFIFVLFLGAFDTRE